MTIGYNHPKQFKNGSEFYPATPLLPGTVMNGREGDKADQPVIGNGSWQISEWDIHGFLYIMGNSRNACATKIRERFYLNRKDFYNKII